MSSVRRRSPGRRSSPRRISTAALALALLSVLSFRMVPAVGHVDLADVLALVLPQVLGAAAAAAAVRLSARCKGPGDGPWQGIAVLIAGLAAFELVGVGLEASHAVGAHGLLDHGGWVALLVAVGLGGAVGLLACAATARIRRFVVLVTRRPAPTEQRVARSIAAALVPSGPVIARHLAGRAPPALSR